MSDLGREIDWEDQIGAEGAEFEPLPAGVYAFAVNTMERGRFPGSDKMAACNKATLDIIVKDQNGNERHVFDDLILNTKMEWKLGQFFTAIGHKKKEESLARPNWSKVPGSTGKLELYINEYTNKNGKLSRNNKVDKYLPPEPTTYKAGDF